MLLHHLFDQFDISLFWFTASESSRTARLEYAAT